MDKILRQLEPDVIHIHAIQNIGVLQACLDFGPTVMTSHDYRLVCPASTYFYRRTEEICKKQCGLGCFTTSISKRCMTLRPKYAASYYYRAKWVVSNSTRFASVIAPSKDARDRLVQAGFSEEQISVNPYFCPMEPKLRPRQIPDQDTITYIGRIAPNKGIRYFLSALARLPDSVKGIVVGNFNERTERNMRDAARSLGCADRIELHRWSSPDVIRAILARTSVLIFPSLWPETLGIVGLEAFSQGVPTIASDVGGVREWLQDAQNGYLVPPKSVDSIVNAVQQILSDKNKMIEFGEHAIDTIRTAFLPQIHVSKLTVVYQRVAFRS